MPLTKTIIAVISVFILLGLGIFTGIIPGLGILENGTVTTNNSFGAFRGTGELIQPENREGFISSYMENGLSESIDIIGKLKWQDPGVAVTGITSYKYIIKAKENSFSSWETISSPGATSDYLSSPNPGNINPPSGITTGGTHNLELYSFRIMGNHYEAIRAELWIYADWNIINWFDDNYQWRLMQVDECHLFPGWGWLVMPTDNQGQSRTLFEIGETVNVNVKTTYGGEAVGEGSNTWRVVLYKPADQGGEEIKHQDYGDNVDALFTFTVTSDMWSDTYSNEYRLEIYNTLLPRGFAPIYTIDFIANVPSDVSFTCVAQSKAGEDVSVSISSEPMDGATIDHFRYDVIYGTNDVLLPSDPLSPLWIIPPFDVDAVSNSATITFTPKANQEGYVTIHAVAVDSGNRASNVMAREIWIYKDPVDGGTGEVPDEVLRDGTGEDTRYGGGHTDVWYEWTPSGGNWEDADAIIIDWIGVLFAFLIVIAFFLIGFLGYGGVKMSVLTTIIGVVVAVLMYAVFFTNMFL